MKQVAKDLVVKKRLQERNEFEVLREFRNSGGYGSSYFWKRLRGPGCQGSEGTKGCGRKSCRGRLRIGCNSKASLGEK